MGHTNYFTVTRKFTEKEWDLILYGAKNIIKRAKKDGIIICDGQGEGKPILNSSDIILNGKACATRSTELDEWDEDLSCETFHLTIETKRDFCKTRELPYDKVVVSILQFAKEVAPDAINIGRDGGWENEVPYPITAIYLAKLALKKRAKKNGKTK